MKPKLDRIPPAVITAADYGRLAVEHVPEPIRAYIDGGSGDERTLAANTAAFAQRFLINRVLRDLAAGNTTTRVLGTPLAHPVMLAPVAHHGLVHDEAECATAAGAAAADALMIVSTLASRTLEDIAAASDGPQWFQLYWHDNRTRTMELAERAARAGYGALVFTADAPVAHVPERAVRAGFALPPELSPANLPSTPAPPRTLEPGTSVVFQGFMADAPRWDDLAWLASQSPLPVLLKGVLHPDDAVRAIDAGLAGVIVSNHGGRTLDRLPASLDCLAAVRAAVGATTTVLLDGGIRRGSDVLIALALGADAVLVGRPQIHALAVAGALGVAHVVRLIREELELAMALAGCARIADIDAQALFTPATGEEPRSTC